MKVKIVKCIFSIFITFIAFNGCGNYINNTGYTISFNTDTIYVNQFGSSIPSSLDILLSKVAEEDIVISLDSADSAALTVPSSVTILKGQSMATVPLTGNSAQASSITVTATYGTTVISTEVFVYDNVLVRQVVSMSPNPATVLINDNITIQVTLNIPAPAGGSTVTLSTTGSIGIVPAIVTVPADQLSTTFNLSSVSTPASGTITVNLGSSSIICDIIVTSH